MAQSEHLPIYKRGYELCLYLEEVVRGFSRYHKYGLGSELRDGARKALSKGPHRRVTHQRRVPTETLSPIGGEGRVRGRSSRILPRVLQVAQDRLDDRLASLEDIMIPEAEHEIPPSREVPRAFLVTKRLLRLGVATAVELDDEKSSGAAEVGDIPPDPVLTSKLPTEEATVA